MDGFHTTEKDLFECEKQNSDEYVTFKLGEGSYK